MKRILLTGASGFIGRHCLPLLLAAGYEVHATSSKEPIETNPAVNWHLADLLDSKGVEALLLRVRPTHLLHLAWNVVPGGYWTSLDNFRWVQASLSMLDAFVRTGGLRVVMAGSCAEYDWSYGYCSESRTPLSPTTAYGICKHALHTMLDAFSAQARVSAAWARIFFLYGPHEHPNRLVPCVIKALLQRRTASCTHANQIRDYLYVKDVAAALVALLESTAEGPVNIASGRPVVLREIIYTIARELNGEGLVQLGALPSPANEPPLVVADVRRLSQEVGWQPNHSLSCGLRQTITWWEASAFDNRELNI